MSEQPVTNTDREIWRQRPEDYYSDSIAVTEEGAISINCRGNVITLPVRDWHSIVSSYLYSQMRLVVERKMDEKEKR